MFSPRLHVIGINSTLSQQRQKQNRDSVNGATANAGGGGGMPISSSSFVSQSNSKNGAAGIKSQEPLTGSNQVQQQNVMSGSNQVGNASYQHGKQHSSSTILPIGQSQTNTTPSNKNNIVLVGNSKSQLQQNSQLGNSIINGDSSSKSNFTKAVHASNNVSSNAVDFELSQPAMTTKIGTQRLSLGSGSKKGSSIRYPNINEKGGSNNVSGIVENKKSTPGAQKTVIQRQSSQTVKHQIQYQQIQNQNVKEDDDQQNYQASFERALKFKSFFEQIAFQNGRVGGGFSTTGGEYYFNETERQSVSNYNGDAVSVNARSDYVTEEDEIKSVVCDLENQRVVRADAERTRGNEALDKDLIELVLTRYCKNNAIKYKQGLNEVLAPFMYMMQDCNKRADRTNDELMTVDIKFVYNSFSGFVHRYLTNFYEEEEFHSLQIALAFLSLLLKYHDPVIQASLFSSQVTPEMYAVPWFLTYFSNKFDINLVIDFWELIISEDDRLFIFYFCIAILIHNRQTILDSDPSHLPQVLARITVQSQAELKTIWKIALTVRTNTPYSFGELPEIKRIFTQRPNSDHHMSENGSNVRSQVNHYDDCDDEQSENSSTDSHNHKEEMMAALERIENMPCLPVLLEEIFFYSYPEILSCSNPICCNSLSRYKILNEASGEESGIDSSSIYSQTSNKGKMQRNQDLILSNQSKRRSQAIDMQDMLSPVRGDPKDEAPRLTFLGGAGNTVARTHEHNNRRLTAVKMEQSQGKRLHHQQNQESYNLNMKANIHDIIKREIHTKQALQLNVNPNQFFNNHQGGANRILSNQPSPTKGLSEQYENYRGIDLSSQRSPFKQMNKQLQAQADGMPLETESNVNDDAQEQQESHIDLINETTRMKHLAINQELRNLQMNGQYLDSEMPVDQLQLSEDNNNNSPNVNFQQVVIAGSQGRMSGMSQQHLGGGNDPANQLHFTPANLNRNFLPSQSNVYYDKGGPGPSNNQRPVGRESDNHSNSSSKRGSIIPLTRHAVPFQTVGASSAQKLEPCNKCVRKRLYEEKQQQESHITSLNDTQTMDEDGHEFYYEKIRFLIVDCRLDSIQREGLLPNSFQLQIPTECTKEYLQGQTEQLLSCKDIYHICMVGLDPLSEKITHKFETNRNAQGKASDNNLEIGAYHESIIRFFIEDFQKKGFKYISIVPGGFQEIHDLALKHSFSLVNHEKPCYHCDKAKDNRLTQNDIYNQQQFNLIGFGDIFSGIKNLYDIAGSKLKNFVKGGDSEAKSEKLTPALKGRELVPSGAPNNSVSNSSNHSSSMPQTHRVQQKYVQNTTFDNILNSKVAGGHSQGVSSLGIPAKLAQQTLQEVTSQSSSAESLYQTITNNNQTSRHHVISQTESRNQGSHHKTAGQQHKTLIKTSENMAKSVVSQGGAQHERRLDTSGNVSLGVSGANYQMQLLKNQDATGSEKLGEMGLLGALPQSFISQQSRQDNNIRFQKSLCSSNASVNSSQNDGGNNLRDAISNKKIMSYKLMSKVPGDRHSEVIQHQQFMIPASSQNSNTEEYKSNHLQQDMGHYSDNQSLLDHKRDSGNRLHDNSSFNSLDQRSDVQSLGNPSSFTYLAITSQVSQQQSEIDRQLSDIRILLSPQSEKPGVMRMFDDHHFKQSQPCIVGSQIVQPSSVLSQLAKGGSETPLSSKHQTDMKSKTVSTKKDYQLVSDQAQVASFPASLGISSASSLSSPPFTEEDLYYINGITKQIEVSLSDLEVVMARKSNITYRAMKLHLKKKPVDASPSGTSSSASSSPSIAYPVYLIITKYTVSVVREMGRRRNMSLLGQVNQSLESFQGDEWDQNDFDELHPSLTNNGGKDAKREGGGRQAPVALIESRFMMYDLIKITSRKSSSKIITFYFRVPLMQDYNSQILEVNMVSQLDQRPCIKYEFAFKRKNYKEVSASFEFSKEEDAKLCISNVSSIYKKLKNSKH